MRRKSKKWLLHTSVHFWIEGHTNTQHAALRIKSFNVNHFQRTSALPVIGRLSAKLPSRKKGPFSVFFCRVQIRFCIIDALWETVIGCRGRQLPPDGPLTVIYELMHADFDFSWHTPCCSGDWQPTKELLSGSAAGTYKNKTAARGAAVTHCTPRRDVDLRWRRCCICTCLVRFCSLWRICCSLLPKETKPETPSVRNAASKEGASRQWKQTKSHKNLTNYAHRAIFSTTVSIFNGLSVCPHLITEHEPRLTTEKKEKKQPPCKLEQGCHWHFQCTNSGQLQIPAKPRIIWWLVGRSGVLKSGRCIQLPQPVPW